MSPSQGDVQIFKRFEKFWQKINERFQFGITALDIDILRRNYFPIAWNNGSREMDGKVYFFTRERERDICS